MSIAENLSIIKNTLAKEVTLVAVSKTKPSSAIIEAYEAGQRVFGENKALELRDKHEELPKDIIWHFIGRLQTNKVKYIAPFVHLIHSVDSEKLLKEINKRAKSNNRVIDVLIQVFIAKEETKAGFSSEKALALLTAETYNNYPNVNIVGFMGMATNSNDENIVGQEFESLKTLFDEAKNLKSDFTILSMGMSNDYPLAISKGANMVRIGSSIFGARNYPTT